MALAGCIKGMVNVVKEGKIFETPFSHTPPA